MVIFAPNFTPGEDDVFKIGGVEYFYIDEDFVLPPMAVAAGSIIEWTPSTSNYRLGHNGTWRFCPNGVPPHTKHCEGLPVVAHAELEGCYENMPGGSVCTFVCGSGDFNGSVICVHGEWTAGSCLFEARRRGVGGPKWVGMGSYMIR